MNVNKCFFFLILHDENDDKVRSQRHREREIAAVLSFMEALEGHSIKWHYDVIGHSGESLHLELVNPDRLPKDDKEWFDVFWTRTSISKFCMASDHTLQATKQSTSSLSEANEIDEAFIILLSDANLDTFVFPANNLARPL